MVQKPIILTITFEARLGKEKELEEALTSVVAPTRLEVGCLFYELHGSVDTPGQFLFYESWASEEHHAAHDQTPHIRNLRARLEKLAFPPTNKAWTNISS